MNIINIGVDFLFLVIGYFIGSIAFSLILTRKKGDLRTKGSGNAGATNTARVYGKKMGLMVFTLDLIKPIVATLIAYYITKSGWDKANGAIIQFAALGAVIGHIYPVFFKFKGGKGAACMLGFIVAMNWILALVGFIIFLGIVISSRYVSLGSILTPLILLFLQIALLFIPSLNESWSTPLMNENAINGHYWLNTIFFATIWMIVTLKHVPNIKRLINKNENKFK